MYTVKIVKNNDGIEGEWRKKVEDIQFIPGEGRE